ncbi:MAG: Tc toxin subunit A [Actinomycetota bacterium]|nr:Tc toxin subunit A [Actinomycetota bacterium]
MLNRITFPLTLGMRGLQVVDLQDALEALLDRRIILRGDAGRRRELAEAIDRERERQFFGENTAGAVSTFQGEHQLQPSGAVDEPTAYAINRLLAELDETRGQGTEFIVRGRVQLEHGEPASAVTVSAIDRDMREEWSQSLGQALTDTRGEYEITYTRDQFRRAEKERADLVIRVLDEQGQELSASDIVFNAERAQTIDVVVTPDRIPRGSEYERYTQELAPVIKNVPISELTDEDLQFLAGETEIAMDRLTHLRRDAQWSQDHDLQASVFYGLLRHGLPASYHLLLAEEPARLAEALGAAIEANIVPAELGDQTEEILQRLEELAVEAADVESEELPGPPVGVVLQTAPITEDERREFIRFTRRHGDVTEPWKRLGEETNLGDDAVGHIQFTLQSHPLVRGHLPTLRAVQELREQRSWTSMRDLTRLTRDDWLTLTEQTVGDQVPAGFETREDFAEAVAYRIEEALPTEVVAHRLSIDARLGSSDLDYFFAANPGFDLIRTPIGDFLQSGADLDRVDDPAQLRDSLEELQRIIRIVPRRNVFDGISAAVSRGYTSAQAIVADGEKTFKRMVTMTPIAGASNGDGHPALMPTMDESWAEDTYAMARERVADTEVIHLLTRDYLIDPLGVVPHVALGDEGLPTWATMFGNVSGCECEHCRSVYGPAAYTAALLKFLDDAPDTETIAGAATRPLRVLSARRSDLQHILLNCPNATTPLPYIDLVNEVLEDAVMGGDPSPRQTEGSAEDLRVAPEHERVEAYERLADAVYPWPLPFDLDHERMLLIAQYLGLEFHRLWSVFGRDTNQVTRAYLRLSQAQWDLLTTTPSAAGLNARWGVADLTTLGRVPIFLDRAGVTYAELETLADSWFLSEEGTGEVTLMRGEDPCDIADDTLDGLSDERLNQVHRFIRLCQHQGWAFGRKGELDAALRVLDANRISAEFLADLAQVSRLARAHRLSVPELVDLDTAGLAGVLGTSAAELALFAQLVGAGGLDSIVAVLDVLEAWPALVGSGFEVRELAYILSGWDEAPPVFTPTEEQIRRLLRALHGFVPVVVAERLASDEIELEIENALTEFGRALDPGLTEDDRRSEIERHRERDLLPRLRARIAEEAIVEVVAERFELPPETVDRLVRPVVDPAGTTTANALLAAQGDPSEPAIRDLARFVAIETTDGQPDVADPGLFEQARLLLVRLDRVARLVRGLGLDRRELDVANLTRTSNGFLDLNRISIEDPTSPPPRSRLQQRNSPAGARWWRPRVCSAGSRAPIGTCSTCSGSPRTGPTTPSI